MLTRIAYMIVLGLCAMFLGFSAGMNVSPVVISYEYVNAPAEPIVEIRTVEVPSEPVITRIYVPQVEEKIVYVKVPIETVFFPDEATMVEWLEAQPYYISDWMTCVDHSFAMQKEAALDGWWMQVRYHTLNFQPHMSIETIAGDYMYRIEPQTHEIKQAYLMFD